MLFSYGRLRPDRNVVTLIRLKEKSTNLPQDFHTFLHRFFHTRDLANAVEIANT